MYFYKLYSQCGTHGRSGLRSRLSHRAVGSPVDAALSPVSVSMVGLRRRSLASGGGATNRRAFCGNYVFGG
eukprot:SAG22_NODE_13964_length_389_cov_0.979310_1_plen_70_part_01